jgi:hypothetical protein
MKIISEEDCHAWVSQKQGRSFDWGMVDHAFPWNITYLIPSDSGRKTALARALSAVLDCSGEGLLWITEWSVYPSSENMSLFIGYRRSLGEHRSVSAAPGHVFVEDDLEAAECLLDLILYFFWDANVFDSRSLWLQFSHDEYVSVHAKDQETLRSVEKLLSDFELKELSRTAC